MHEAVTGLSLLAAAIRAGHTPHLALATLRRSHGPMGDFAARYWAGHLAGASVVEAVRAAEQGDTLPGLVPVVIAATERGYPLADQIDRLALEVGHRHARQVQRKVRRLPVLMLFPLVTLILPSFVLLTITPVMVGAIDAIRGSL